MIRQENDPTLSFLKTVRVFISTIKRRLNRPTTTCFSSQTKYPARSSIRFHQHQKKTPASNDTPSFHDRTTPPSNTPSPISSPTYVQRSVLPFECHLATRYTCQIPHTTFLTLILPTVVHCLSSSRTYHQRFPLPKDTHFRACSHPLKCEPFHCLLFAKQPNSPFMQCYFKFLSLQLLLIMP